MDGLTVRMSGGFGRDHPQMSDSLRARIATADVEYERAGEQQERTRLARADVAYQRALDDWVVRQSSAAGIPMRDVYRSLASGGEMPPGVGMSHGDRLAYVSAAMDLEDAQERSRRRAALRRAWVDPDSGDDLDVPEPPALHYEIAARMMPDDADPAAVARGVRGRWLRGQYRGMA
jgi:hypothetical protein